jgi:hypothetical protein
MASNSEISELIKGLIARRNHPDVGASSPEGRRISTLIEQLENGAPSAQTIKEIEQIRRDGGQYVHEHHDHSKGAM